MTNRDQPGLLPATVTVVFPRSDGGTPTGTAHTEVVSLLSLELPEAAGTTGHAGTQVLYTTAVVNYVSGSPTNGAEALALAQALARDWYLFQLGRPWLTYAQVVPYTPDGLTDMLEWEWAEDRVATRAWRGPYDTLAQPESFHEGSQGSGGDPCTCSVFPYDVWFITQTTTFSGSTIEFNNSTININSTSVLNIYGVLHLCGDLCICSENWPVWSSDQEDVSQVGDEPVKRIASSTEVTLGGIVPHCDGQLIFLKNIGDYCIQLLDESTGSTAAYRFALPNDHPLTLDPDAGVLLWYDGTSDRWRVSSEHGPWRYWTTEAHTLTQDEDDYDTGCSMIVRLDADGNYVLTGLTGGFDGAWKIIVNVDATNTLTLNHLDGNSAAGNRFFLADGLSIKLYPNDVAFCNYDATISAWHVFISSAIFGPAGAGHHRGLVPYPPSNAATGSTHFLRADGTWAVPPDTGPEDVSVKVNRQSNQSIGSGWQTVSFVNEQYDTDGFYDNATSATNIVIPEAGKYLLTAWCEWAALGSSTGLLEFRFMKGGTVELARVSQTTDDAGIHQCVTVCELLAASDVITVEVRHYTGTARNLARCYCEVHKWTGS